VVDPVAPAFPRHPLESPAQFDIAFLVSIQKLGSIQASEPPATHTVAGARSARIGPAIGEEAVNIVQRTDLADDRRRLVLMKCREDASVIDVRRFLVG